MKDFLKASLLALSIALISVHVHAQSWNYVGSPDFGGDTCGSVGIAISAQDTPYVMFAPHEHSFFYPGPLTVMKYDGAGWTTVGSPAFTEDSTLRSSIGIDPAGVPYVCFADHMVPSVHNGRITAMKYDGANWVTVGAPDFSTRMGNFLSKINFDGSGTPYVAWGDSAASVSVKKFDGSNWVYVGSPSFIAGGVQNGDLAIDATGTPYLAYTSQADTYRVSVMKFNGSSWTYVGAPGFTDHGDIVQSIAIDNDGNPYVAYLDGANGNKATVMKYTASSGWVYVGSTDFSAGAAADLELRFNGAGTPYVLYGDGANGYKATVMKFNGTDWVAVGVGGFSPGKALPEFMAISRGAIPYVVYADYTDSVRISVEAFTEPLSSILGLTTMCTGASVTLSDTANGGMWASANTAIAMISDSSGVVTGVSAGTTTISYSAYGSTVTIEIEVDSCATTAVQPSVAATSYLYMFPDPSSGTFTLNLKTPQKEDATIIITNILAEKVKELTALTNTDTQIQLNEPPGVYFVSVVTKEGRVNEKIIIE